MAVDVSDDEQGRRYEAVNYR